MKLLALTLLASVLGLPAASAQPAAIKVFYRFKPDGWARRPMDGALHAALARPQFSLQTKISSDTLVITGPEDAEWISRATHTEFAFSLTFSRDGDKLGESQEDCHTDKLDDCIDQLVADVQNAAAITR